MTEHIGSCIASIRLADIDDENVKSSKRNVTLNKLDSRIRIVKTDATDGLIPLNDKTGVERYACMHQREERNHNERQ